MPAAVTDSTRKSASSKASDRLVVNDISPSERWSERKGWIRVCVKVLASEAFVVQEIVLWPFAASKDAKQNPQQPDPNIEIFIASL